MKNEAFYVPDEFEIEQMEMDAIAKGAPYLGFDKYNRPLGIPGLEQWYMKHGLMGTSVFAKDGFSMKEMVDALAPPLPPGPTEEKDPNDQISWEESTLPMLEMRYSFRNLMGDVRENTHSTVHHVEIWYGKDIYGYNGPKTEEPNRKIGEVEVTLMRWERAKRYDSVYYVLGFGNHDAFSDDFFSDSYHAVMKPEWEAELATCTNKNILRICNLRLDYEFRGRGWGHYIIKQIIETFSDQCGIVYLVPWPTCDYLPKDSSCKGNTPAEEGWVSSDCTHGVDRAREAYDTARLIRYFERMGFTSMYPERSTYFYAPTMYINLSRPNPRLSHVDTYVYLDY